MTKTGGVGTMEVLESTSVRSVGLANCRGGRGSDNAERFLQKSELVCGQVSACTDHSPVDSEKTEVSQP